MISLNDLRVRENEYHQPTDTYKLIGMISGEYHWSVRWNIYHSTTSILLRLLVLLIMHNDALVKRRRRAHVPLEENTENTVKKDADSEINGIG